MSVVSLDDNFKEEPFDGKLPIDTDWNREGVSFRGQEIIYEDVKLEHIKTAGFCSKYSDFWFVDRDNRLYNATLQSKKLHIISYPDFSKFGIVVKLIPVTNDGVFLIAENGAVYAIEHNHFLGKSWVSVCPIIELHAWKVIDYTKDKFIAVTEKIGSSSGCVVQGIDL